MSVIVGFGASWFGSDYDLQLSGAQRNHTPHHIYYLMVEVRIWCKWILLQKKIILQENILWLVLVQIASGDRRFWWRM